MFYTTCHSVISNATLKIYAQSCDYPVEEEDFKELFLKPNLSQPRHLKFMPCSECLVDGIPEDIKQFRQIWRWRINMRGNDNLDCNLKGKNIWGRGRWGFPGIWFSWLVVEGQLVNLN